MCNNLRLLTSMTVALMLASMGTAALADDTALHCSMTREWLGVWSPKGGTPISNDFYLKFNDSSKKVTYVGGPAMSVENSSTSVNTDQITFSAWSPLSGNSQMSYYGKISRLPGEIQLRKFVVRAHDGGSETTEQEYERAGICVPEKPKF